MATRYNELASEALRTPMNSEDRLPLVCLSHLRWNSVFQRPHHLLTRFAAQRPVYFIEEPEFGTHSEPYLNVVRPRDGIFVLVPILPKDLAGSAPPVIESLVADYLKRERIARYDLWYYTPMALRYTRSLKGDVVVYDCMDDLGGFKGAPQSIRQLETALLAYADVVFTGGNSLFEVKRGSHSHVHCFPSSIDKAHFATARTAGIDPDDQAGIAHPRIGYFGVIDERLNLELVKEAALRRPEWQFVFIGPLAKISESDLPRADNIHYLGKKDYLDLPQYLSGWDVGMMPFAHNDATRCISPTKTPEYLAAGKPVVSTGIRDVIRPYGEMGLVSIADSVDDFVRALEYELSRRNDSRWLSRVDQHLSTTSWDSTWAEMSRLISAARHLKRTHFGRSVGADTRRGRKSTASTGTASI